MPPPHTTHCARGQQERNIWTHVGESSGVQEHELRSAILRQSRQLTSGRRQLSAIQVIVTPSRTDGGLKPPAFQSEHQLRTVLHLVVDKSTFVLALRWDAVVLTPWQLHELAIDLFYAANWCSPSNRNSLRR